MYSRARPTDAVVVLSAQEVRGDNFAPLRACVRIWLIEQFAVRAFVSLPRACTTIVEVFCRARPRHGRRLIEHPYGNSAICPRRHRTGDSAQLRARRVVEF